MRHKPLPTCLALGLLLMSMAVSSAIALDKGADAGAPKALKVHGIFRSHMVLQRDKPITIWGWAPVGAAVTVTLGEETVSAKAGDAQI